MNKILATLAVATVALIGSSAPALAASANPQSTDSAANHVSYWQDFTAASDVCTKVEMTGNVTTYTLPQLASGQQYTLLVLKAGSGVLANTVDLSPDPGVAYGHSTGKDLSHVIYCVGAGQGIVYT